MNRQHPIQPLELDDKGVLRFKTNPIVRYLLDNGGIDMNHLAMKSFDKEDREQFAQLIGYSLSGAGDLDYFGNLTWNTASRMYEDGLTEAEAHIRELEEQLTELREAVKEPIARLFGIHPDDLDHGHP